MPIGQHFLQAEHGLIFKHWTQFADPKGCLDKGELKEKATAKNT